MASASSLFSSHARSGDACVADRHESRGRAGRASPARASAAGSAGKGLAKRGPERAGAGEAVEDEDAEAALSLAEVCGEAAGEWLGLCECAYSLRGATAAADGGDATRGRLEGAPVEVDPERLYRALFNRLYSLMWVCCWKGTCMET